MGGMGSVLAWAAWVACLSNWRASVSGVGGVLVWVAWVASLGKWRAIVGDMPAWVMWVFMFMCLCELYFHLASYSSI